MIEQFLFTNAGERVNRPDFGSGLLQLVFAPNSPELAAAVQFTVQAGLQRWLGDVIEVQAVEVTSRGFDPARRRDLPRPSHAGEPGRRLQPEHVDEPD